MLSFADETSFTYKPTEKVDDVSLIYNQFFREDKEDLELRTLMMNPKVNPKVKVKPKVRFEDEKKFSSTPTASIIKTENDLRRLSRKTETELANHSWEDNPLFVQSPLYRTKKYQRKPPPTPPIDYN